MSTKKATTAHILFSSWQGRPLLGGRTLHQTATTHHDYDDDDNDDDDDDNDDFWFERLRAR